MRLALLPFTAKHLSTRQSAAQLKSFERALEKLGGLSVVGPKSSLRFIKSTGRSTRALARAHENASLIQALCERLQVDLLVTSEMKIGSEKKLPKVLTRAIACQSGEFQMQSTEFSGRLTPALWREVAGRLDSGLPRLMSKKQSAAPLPLARSNPSGFSPSPPLGSPPAPSMGSMGSNESTKPLTTQRVRKATMLSPQARDPWAARFTLWAEGRVMNRTFEYKSRPTGLSLKGGITYTSRWITGYGGAARFRLSEQFSLEGELSEYKFTSTQVIYNLFDDNDFIQLNSAQRVASLGGVFSQTFSLGARQNRAGARVGWRMSQHEVGDNNEYTGFTAHGIELQVLTLLALSDESSWIELRGKLTPLLTLGDSVKELGESSESIGFGFELSLVQRWEGGLGLKLGVSFDELLHTPTGSGRGGRQGLEAADQLLQVKLGFGWMGPQ